MEEKNLLKFSFTNIVRARIYTLSTIFKEKLEKGGVISVVCTVAVFSEENSYNNPVNALRLKTGIRSAVHARLSGQKSVDGRKEATVPEGGHPGQQVVQHRRPF